MFYNIEHDKCLRVLTPGTLVLLTVNKPILDSIYIVEGIDIITPTKILTCFIQF